MKAVIVEVRKFYAAALTNDGCVIKVKNKNYAIGEVIKLKNKKTSRKTKFALFAASAAAVVILFGVTLWAYFTPYSYVSLDVNPSIEYELNRFDRVLSATAVNNDGSEILSNINLNNMTINEAVKSTVNEIEEEGYFEGQDPGSIVISTSGEDEDEAKQLAENLQTTAKEETTENTSPVEVEVVSVGLQRVKEARDLGTTPGKLNLVQKMQAGAANPDEIDVEEWLNKPVKEIMKVIKQNKKNIDDNTEQPETDSSAQSAPETDSSAQPDLVSEADKSEMESSEVSKLDDTSDIISETSETPVQKERENSKSETNKNVSSEAKIKKDKPRTSSCHKMESNVIGESEILSSGKNNINNSNANTANKNKFNANTTYKNKSHLNSGNNEKTGNSLHKPKK